MEDRKLVPVEHHPGFAKDSKSGAILNTNNDALRAYRKQKRILTQSVETTSRMDVLEAKVMNIESLLQQILGKL